MKVSIAFATIFVFIFALSQSVAEAELLSKKGGYSDENEQEVECTPEALDAAEQYDPDMQSNMECLAHTSDVNIVVAWNNDIKNPKMFKKEGITVSQQAVNVRNLAKDYENNYDMEHGEGFDVVVVAYFSGVDWLRKTSDQANQDFINNEVLKRGIKIYACQNSMKAKGLKLADLIDGVSTVPAGVTAVVDFQGRGRTYIVP
mmetsp:Transcript_11338/g.17378  ORF Transcript_11338/g.17378 Transcript_11338/m.17378 type:complete len:202 (-) Transcript_11338:51-656(-)